MFDSLESIVAQAADIVRPPERLTVSQAAVKYRKLNNPGSYVGPWDNSIAPYLVEPMDVLTSHEHTGMVFIGPARTGKSDMCFNWITHTRKCDPADMMVVHMTQASGRDWSQRDLDRLFRHSPEVGRTVAPGRQNRNVHDIKFIDGTTLLVKWPTITELSGKTIPRLWLMDYDRMPEDVSGEGTPFDLAKKRAQTFKRYGMTVAETSPGFPVEDPKWLAKTPHEAPPTKGGLALYNRGDRRRRYWRCISCSGVFEPSFSLLRYPDSADKRDAAEQACLPCPHCGQIYHHDPDEKNGIPGKNGLDRAGKWLKDGQLWLPDGTVTGSGNRSDIASFWLKGPVAAFTTWSELVYKYLSAMEEYERTGSQDALKVTINTDQGEPFIPIGEASNRLPEELKSRAVDLGERVVPPGVRFLVATIDVQKSRFVVQVQGICPGGDIMVIDRFDIRKSRRLDDDGERLWIKPGSYLEDWDILIDEVLTKAYPLSDDSGRRMVVKAVGCDSGGSEGVTTNAYNFWRRLRDDEEGRDLHKRFMLIKGASNKGAPRVQTSYPDSERKDRRAGARGEVPILLINPNMLKDTLDALLDRRAPGGGMISFAKWLPDNFFTELTAEVRLPTGWDNPKNHRNESWDLLVYTLAVCLSAKIGIERIDWQDPPGWADDWDVNDLVFAAEINRPFENQQKEEYDLEALASELA